MPMAELVLNSVSKRFGGLLAVDNLDLEVPEGRILSLIGPNGAGKTTVFNMITGVYPPSDGTISYGGRKLNHLRSTASSAAGIARTFQNIRLFKSMTVLENVQVGMYCQDQKRCVSGAVQIILCNPGGKRNHRKVTRDSGVFRLGRPPQRICIKFTLR